MVQVITRFDSEEISEQKTEKMATQTGVYNNNSDIVQNTYYINNVNLVINVIILVLLVLQFLVKLVVFACNKLLKKHEKRTENRILNQLQREEQV